jgi:hypothetical protein
LVAYRFDDSDTETVLMLLNISINKHELLRTNISVKELYVSYFLFLIISIVIIFIILLTIKQIR